MSTITTFHFDHVYYDRPVDVLYVREGPSSRAVDFDETPEGHHTRYGSDGRLVGVTVLHPRRVIGWPS